MAFVHFVGYAPSPNQLVRRPPPPAPPPTTGAGTDYTKCFNLIPQAISMVVLEEQGIDAGVLRAFQGMYSQLRRMFKIKGCLGAWWAATNGVLQGCPLINALTTTWKRIIDDVKEPVKVTDHQETAAGPEEGGTALVLLVQLWNGPGLHLGMEMRTALLLLGAGVVGRRRTEAPTGSGPRRDPSPTPETSRMPSRGAHAGGEDVGSAGAAGNAHPRKHSAFQSIAERYALTGRGVQ